ncbi:diguanylate cyclase domain-containing protein [Burkholderia ubonensis]|uniref:diguanylate cyclase domain-containing protein n=1 Tax=Burkholderia ubonensis TaxID=101571 RepID=UPI00075B9116|nr:diguanylate cyclase [Burkholderia ubonensis]KVC86000.1 diguanylate cyclase [Burkholderia ubonensis]KVG69742.1 diguanylate cyclase [Burkholderia ubonensis]KVH18756.1 diguanylate cyclase [Burkholderia ubonensis]KVH49479.1 diguanylate cyclase [Burkholderia ubonensis]KVH86512.1 diguanylate cyclase [Burkholderia ubonensis]
MTRSALPVSPSRMSRPTLQSVLRRAHLRLAFVAVAMAAVSLIVVAVIALRAYAGNNLNLLARSLGYTVEAALVFGDRVAAAEAIALIASDEDVAQVVVTDGKGQPFATWQLPAGSKIARLERSVADLALPGPVTIPVVHDGSVVGHVVVRGRGHQFFGFLLGGVGGILGCLAVSVFGAYVSSKRLLRSIVSPLRALADVAHAVRRERAFEQRVEPVAIAELNQLGDDFNALLDELEDWQNTLRDENASLEHKATHDALTGLPNRAQFESRLALALSEATVTSQRVAVLYLDCDRFKEINDGFGHEAGDMVLIGIASRLRAQLREADLVARLGGDEFAVMLAPVREADSVVRIADAILSGMTPSIVLADGRAVPTMMSIGIALYPDHASDASGLLRAADAAMYRAKRTRPGSWQLAEGVAGPA